MIATTDKHGRIFIKPETETEEAFLRMKYAEHKDFCEMTGERFTIQKEENDESFMLII